MMYEAISRNGEISCLDIELQSYDKKDKKNGR